MDSNGGSEILEIHLKRINENVQTEILMQVQRSKSRMNQITSKSAKRTHIFSLVCENHCIDHYQNLIILLWDVFQRERVGIACIIATN